MVYFLKQLLFFCKIIFFWNSRCLISDFAILNDLFSFTIYTWILLFLNFRESILLILNYLKIWIRSLIEMRRLFKIRLIRIRCCILFDIHIWNTGRRVAKSLILVLGIIHYFIDFIMVNIWYFFKSIFGFPKLNRS